MTFLVNMALVTYFKVRLVFIDLVLGRNGHFSDNLIHFVMHADDKYQNNQ